MAAVSFVQVVLTAGVLGHLFAAVRRLGAPRWIVWAMVAWLGLSPVFGHGVIAVWKDTAFAIAGLWVVLLVLRAVETGKIAISLGLALALVWLLRHNGPAIVVPAFAAARWYWPENRVALRKIAVLCLACVAVATIAARLTGLVPSSPFLKRQHLTHLVTGMMANGAQLTTEEQAILGPLPVDVWRPAYDCRSVDNLLWWSMSTKDPLFQDPHQLLPVAAHLVLRYPGLFVRHWACVTRYLWAPTAEMNIGPFDAEGSVIAANPFGIATESRLPFVHDVFTRVWTLTLRPRSILRFFVWQPAFPLAVVLGALTVAVLRFRSAMPVVVLMPALTNTIVWLVLSVTPDVRFQWLVFLLAPVAVCLAACSPKVKMVE